VTFEVADAGGYTAQQTMQFTVGQTTQTLSWPPDGEATGYVGGSWVLSGAVASSGLPVSYSVPLSSESVCVLVGSSVVFLAAGTCTVEATQAGNTTWASAGTVQQSKRVLPVPVVAATGPAPVATPGPAPLPVVGVGSSAVVRASHATLDISCAVIACSGSVALSVARRGPGGAVSHLVVASGGYSLAAGATGLVSLTMSAASRALLTRASGRTKWRVTATVVAGSVVSHDPVELVWVRKPRRMTAGHR
jgi:type V secretory pathway adhesin AidA